MTRSKLRGLRLIIRNLLLIVLLEHHLGHVPTTSLFTILRKYIR